MIGQGNTLEPFDAVVEDRHILRKRVVAGHRFCLFWGGYWLGWRDRTEQAEVDGLFERLGHLLKREAKQ